MAFTEKIRVVLDLDGKTFMSSIKSVRTEMATADGLFNKLKVGTKGLGDAFNTAAKNPVVMGAAVAGAGAAAFAAVNKFADLALEVGRMSEATGVATEPLSRLLEVTGDIGIEAGTVEKSIGFMNKTLGGSPEKFLKLGVAIEQAGDGTIDANETFLNVVDTLNAIDDPAKKAYAAQQLLGKGWKEMAELIGQGSGAIRDSLAEVGDAKVINDAEVAKARDFRAAMDNLNDKFEEIALTAGTTLIPVLTKIVDLIALIVPAGAGGVDGTRAEFERLAAAIEAAGGSIEGFESSWATGAVTLEYFKNILADLTRNEMAETTRETRRLEGALGDAALATGETERETRRLGDTTATLRQNVSDLAPEFGTLVRNIEDNVAAAGHLGTASHDLSRDFDPLSREAKNVADALREAEEAYRSLSEQISGERTFLELKGDFADLQETAAATLKEVAEGTMTAEERADIMRGKVLDIKDAVIDLGVKYKDIPKEKITNIVALVDQGKYDEAIWMIEVLRQDAEAKVTLDTRLAQRAMDDLERRIQTFKGVVNVSVKLTGAGVAVLGKAGMSVITSKIGVVGAEGGIVTRPTVAMIGEAGPEAVIPLNQTPGSSPLSVGLGDFLTSGTAGIWQAEVSAAEAAADAIGTTEDDMMRRKYERQLISYEEYRRYLDSQERAASEMYGSLSDQEAVYYDALAQLEEDHARQVEEQQRRIQDAIQETLDLQAKAFADAVSAQDEAVDNEEAVRAQAEATDLLAVAQAQLDAVMADAAATDEERAAAIRDVERAQLDLAKATATGAAAQANIAGFADNTQGYYDYIKSAIDQYIAGHNLGAAGNAALLSAASRAAIQPASSFASGSGGGVLNVNLVLNDQILQAIKIRTDTIIRGGT